jgi:hypothetical protein
VNGSCCCLVGARRYCRNMARVPIPFAHYPRSGEDLATLDERLGGRTSMVIGPPTHGSKGKPEFIELWLEFEKEFIPPGRPSPTPPANPLVRTFLKALAKRSAGAWTSQAAKAKGW